MDRQADYASLDDDLDDADYMDDGDEFVEFVSRLAERNRHKEVRDYIERREASRRLRDDLGLELSDLPSDY